MRPSISKAMPLVLSGILAFAGGFWFFLPKASPRAAVHEPTPAEAPAPDEAPVAADPEAEAPLAENRVVPRIPPAPEQSAPAGAVAAPRLSRAKFEAISDGMTEEQVNAILGEPTEIRFRSDTRRNDTPVVKIHQWTQLTPAGSIEVYFTNGLSSAKSTTFAAAPPPKKEPGPDPALAFPGTRLTQVNFAKIKLGMTEDQVTEILGPARGSATSTITSSGATHVTRTLTWRLGGDNNRLPRYLNTLPKGLTITVTFRDGAVSGTNWMWIGPIPKAS